MNQEQEPNQIALTSPDGKEARLAELRRLFPDLFDGEGVLDGKALRQLISEEVGHVTERFSFEWAGKAQSKRFAFAPSKATLIYDPARSVNTDGTPSKPGESLQENTSQNLIIEGDNLEVLKLLQASYFEKVKCIYIDPPYNTGNDFIYPDDFSQSLQQYWENENFKKNGVRLRSIVAGSGRRHSDWLNFMYSRLLLARNILREDGVMFISIGEDEVSHLRLLTTEIFGEDNYITTISRVMKTGGGKGTFFTPNIDYIITVAKNKNLADPFRINIGEDQIESYYNKTEVGGDRDGERYGEERLYLPNLEPRPNQRYWIECPDGSFVIPPGISFPTVLADGEKVLPTDSDRVWRWTYPSYLKAKNDGRIIFKETTTSGLVDQNRKQSRYNIYFKLWLKDQEEKGKVPSNFIKDIENRKSASELSVLGVPFDFAKPTQLLEFLLLASRASDHDIVMDFFAGSGSFAHAVLQHNSKTGHCIRHISVQIPEVILEGSKEFEAGYRKISDITIDRVTKAGAHIRNDSRKEGLDIGFRVLELAKSHFPKNTFTPDPEKGEAENMKALEDHLQAAAQLRLFGDDGFHSVVTEIALKNGFGLFYTLERQEAFSKNTVYRMQGNDKDAILCLDGELSGTTIEALKAYSDDQLIVLKAALDTTKKFELQTAFKDNLWVV